MAKDDLRATALSLAEQWWEPEKTAYCATSFNMAVAKAAEDMGFDTEELYQSTIREIHRLREKE